MAVLDTTVLVDLSRGPENPFNIRVGQRLAELLKRGEMLMTSRINEAEFRVGPHRSRDQARELRRVERVLATLVILEFDARAAVHYAEIKADLLRRGTPIGDFDTLIAAIAMTHGERIVTRDPKHFFGVPGLIVESY